MQAVPFNPTLLSSTHAAPWVDPSDSPCGVAALTRQLAVGNEAAFREFHRRYFDRLYHFLLVVTRGNEHAAQDALQETLLRVVRYAREFREEDVFWGWLKSVARNAARDAGRRERRYLAILTKLATGFVNPAISSSLDRGDDQLRELLADGLAGLEPESRRLIEGKYVRGATVAELATEAGTTEKAIESRLLRVRRQLSHTILQLLRAK